MNALNPCLMAASERLDEIGEILAAGLMRLRSRQSSELSPISRECPLHISPNPRDVAASFVESAL